MKQIIIMGICLVTAAIVYGFVDYLKTDKKQLQRMYGDEPAAAVIPASVALPVAPATVTAKEVPAVPPSKTSTLNPFAELNAKLERKKFNLNLYSRSALRVNYIEPDSAETIRFSVAKPAVLSVPVVNRPAAPAVGALKRSFAKPLIGLDTEKVISLSFFSRGPLRRKKAVAIDTVTTVKDVMPAEKKQ